MTHSLLITASYKLQHWWREHTGGEKGDEVGADTQCFHRCAFHKHCLGRVVVGDRCAPGRQQGQDTGCPQDPRLDRSRAWVEVALFLSLLWLCRAWSAWSVIVRAEKATTVTTPCHGCSSPASLSDANKTRVALFCPRRQRSRLCPCELLRVPAGAVGADPDPASADEWFEWSFLSTAPLHLSVSSLQSRGRAGGTGVEVPGGFSAFLATSMFKP